MNKKLLSTLIATALLQGCIEVDEIEQQNELLAEQNEILRQANQPDTTQSAENPINLYGTIIDSVTEEPVGSGTVKVKIGNTWSEPVELTTGTFELTKLPIYSDYLLMVESGDNAFMPRVISGRTGYGEAGSNVYSDLGAIKVGTPTEYVLKVMDVESGEHLSGLEFIANSNSVSAYVAKAYYHKSTEDQTAGTYSITVPQGLVESFTTSLDIDGDDEADYNLEVSEQNFTSSQGELSYWVDRGDDVADNEVMLEPVVEIEDPATETFDIRFSVVDRDAAAVAGLEVETETGVAATFDETSEQYSLSVDLREGGYARILIPSFEKDGYTYYSTTISIYFDEVDVSVAFSSSNNTTSNVNYDVETRELDLVSAPRNYMSSSDDADILYSQQSVTAPDYTHKVFYSKPIELLENSVTLEEVTKLKVVRGDESSTDFVPAGTTRFIREDVAVESTATLSNNDTLLKVAPVAELAPYTNYSYKINELKVKGTDVTFTDSRANESFWTSMTTEEAFDINDVVVDNNNHATNDMYIKTENTAGETFSTYVRNGRIMVLFPNSVANLENFTMRLIGKVSNGTLISKDSEFVVVRDGEVKTGYYHAVGLAYNENIIGSVSNVSFGLSVDDGKYFMYKSLYEYMDDHTGTDENTVTFEYSYETKDGKVTEGTITYPVK